MTSNSAEDGITALTYEAALAELDTLITKLEGGSIALEEAIGPIAWTPLADGVRQTIDVLRAAPG